MDRVVLGIGGNLGDREALLKDAVRHLESKMRIVKKSSIYETAAWGGNSSLPYLNQVVVMETGMSPEEVLDFVQEVEQQHGRVRNERWGDRTMDIDILYFGKQIIHTDRLQVPHPRLPHRNFVLKPLAEVLPDFLHPKNGLSQKELLERCGDTLSVRLWPGT
ncbi:2-amino-4-hydroxy-6-hydroxymethyldihydropteridine diphosphokinase [Negadavirga shengliensis]|uniref:2-amino-4-hydroxy-6-hydroxymethyldihydropteridine pyrophosphokinase n=1 Tax=Negadavirga shengliensis TaxID=1389218 RepID=A0ABV9SXX2_9BACT